MLEWLLQVAVKTFGWRSNTKQLFDLFYEIISRENSFVIAVVEPRKDGNVVKFNYDINSVYAEEVVFVMLSDSMRNRESDIFLSEIMKSKSFIDRTGSAVSLPKSPERKSLQ